MTEPSYKTHQVTELLAAWSQGDKEALDKLMPLVYDELRRLARQQMRHERAGHTLQTTALVNEAYLMKDWTFAKAFMHEAVSNES